MGLEEAPGLDVTRGDELADWTWIKLGDLSLCSGFGPGRGFNTDLQQQGTGSSLPLVI